MRNADDIEAAIAGLGARLRCGLLVAPDGFTQAYDTFIVGLVARHRVPTVFGVDFARTGGLMSHRPDFVEVFCRAATYIDRVNGLLYELESYELPPLPLPANVHYAEESATPAARGTGVE